MLPCSDSFACQRTIDPIPASPIDLPQSCQCSDAFEDVEIGPLTSPQKRSFPRRPGDSQPLPVKTGFIVSCTERRRSTGDVSAFCFSPKKRAEGWKEGQAFCRICLEVESEERLVAPCECKGSQKFVHKDCLKKWVQFRAKQPECEVCKYVYHVRLSYTTVFRPCSSPRETHLPAKLQMHAQYRESRFWQPFTLFLVSVTLFCALLLSWMEDYIDEPMIVSFGFISSLSTFVFFTLSLTRARELWCLRRIDTWDIDPKPE